MEGSGRAPSGPELGIGGFEGAVEIGRGGFGVVYRVRQIDFDRTVAIKVLGGVVDAVSQRRFERERRAMGSLSSHPNIVTVFGSGITDDGHPYIVMEYLPGGSLGDQLVRDGPVPWAEVFAIGIKVSAALEEAHGAGILHRDIKPENILVSKYGEPKLADFGIARVLGGPETASGVITASIGHSPPEVIEGRRPTPAADVYSLASTLHTLINGRLPFARDTDESIVPMLARIATEPPPDLRGRGVPGPAAAALEHAMAKDPARRSATAAELGDLLVAARKAGLEATGRPPTWDRVLIRPPAAPQVAPPVHPPPYHPPPYSPPPLASPQAPSRRTRSVAVMVGAAVVAVISVVVLVISVGGDGGSGDQDRVPVTRDRD